MPAVRNIYLPLVSSLSLLSLITQSVPALADTSEPTAISSENVTTTETKVLPGVQAIAGQESSYAQSNANLSQTTPVTTEQDQTGLTTTTQDQMTSVNQLSDVRPTDWAFQALQSLIERYGVVSGYPNGTYRGNRAINRYEFAAALQAALDRVNELLASGVQVSRDDLVTLQRLRSEFAADLANLRGRVDGLEARTANLQANQFSTTTKLAGQVIFTVNPGGFGGRRIIDPTGAVVTNQQPGATFLYRAALDFNTSFRGTDLLKLRLDGLSGRGKDNVAGYLEPNLGSAFEYTLRGTPNPNFGVSRLYYSFTPVKDLSLTIGPEIVDTDFIDINSYANGNGIDFSTLALVNNYLLFPVNGPSAGAFLNWNPGQGAFKLRALYVAAGGAFPDRNSNNQTVVGALFPFTTLLHPNGGGRRGIFGDPYQGTVELEYSPSKALAVRLQYSGGTVFNGRFDVFGANLELALNKQLAVFGRYGYSNYNDTAFGNIHPNYWMAGVSWRDFFVPGAVAGLAAGQPFIDNAVGNGTQTNIEGFYNFPISDNLRVTPVIQVITHPGNQNSNGTIITGSIRTVFSF